LLFGGVLGPGHVFGSALHQPARALVVPAPHVGGRLLVEEGEDRAALPDHHVADVPGVRKPTRATIAFGVAIVDEPDIAVRLPERVEQSLRDAVLLEAVEAHGEVDRQLELAVLGLPTGAALGHGLEPKIADRHG
jgi:hypothetical protein